MKRIKLSGKLGEGSYALVDDEDYERVNKYRWHLLNDRPSRTVHFVMDGREREMAVFMHNEVLGRLLKPGETHNRKMHVDHINGNPLDNRRNNLRLCTASQNSMNRRISNTNTTGYKGVCKRRGGKYYLGIVRIGGKSYCGKSRKTAVEAAEDYNELAKKLCGEFALLNVI